MESKKIIKLILNFKIYLAVLFILILVLILKDLKNFSTVAETTHTLVVESDEQNCYVKGLSSLTWNKLFKNDLISAPSLIETLSNSSLSLNFINFNGFLNLSENTSIELNQYKNEIVIDFKKGEMFVAYHIQNDKIPLRINFKNNSIVVNTSDVFLRQDRDGVILSVNYGEVELFREDQRDDQKITLKSGDVFKVNSKDQYVILEPEIKFLTPLNEDRYILVDKAEVKVRVAWKGLGQLASQYQVLLGKSINELKSVFKSTKASKNEAFLNLQEGSYYLQIASQSKTSDIIKLFVEKQIPVRPLFPNPDQIFTKKIDEVEVKFQWENPSQFEKLFLEISHNSQFSDLIFHETIQFGNYFLISIKKPGTYYWRVNGFPKKSSKLVLGDSRRLIIE